METQKNRAIIIPISVLCILALTFKSTLYSQQKPDQHHDEPRKSEPHHSEPHNPEPHHPGEPRNPEPHHPGEPRNPEPHHPGEPRNPEPHHPNEPLNPEPRHPEPHNPELRHPEIHDDDSHFYPENEHSDMNNSQLYFSGTNNYPAGSLIIYDETGFAPGGLGFRIIQLGLDIPSLEPSPWNFNAVTSSFRFDIPDGWECDLYANKNYNKLTYSIRGRGEIFQYSPDNTLSSIKWRKMP